VIVVVVAACSAIICLPRLTVLMTLLAIQRREFHHHSVGALIRHVGKTSRRRCCRCAGKLSYLIVAHSYDRQEAGFSIRIYRCRPTRCSANFVSASTYASICENCQPCSYNQATFWSDLANFRLHCSRKWPPLHAWAWLRFLIGSGSIS